MSVTVKRSYEQAFDGPQQRQDPAKKVEVEDPELPPEIWEQIFSLLPAIDLGRASLTCRDFKVWTANPDLWKKFDLTSVFPHFTVNVLDKEDWETYADLEELGLVPEDISPIDKKLAIREAGNVIARLRKNKMAIEGDEGITIMTLPKKLSFILLRQFALNPKKGKRTGFSSILPYLLQTLRENTVEKSYQLIITNSILANTRNKTPAEQDDMLETIGCVRPAVLEIATLVFSTFIRSPVSVRVILYSTPSFTMSPVEDGIYTRTRNEIPLMIGGYQSQFFHPIPLLSIHPDPLAMVGFHSLTFPYLGMGAVRIF